MKRLSYLFLFLLLFVGQSIAAQNEAKTLTSPEVTATPSSWFSWFKSLRTPNREDARRAQAYVNSKWRCLRHGENCSKTERVKLGLLAAAITALIGKGVHSALNPTHSITKQRELLSAAEGGRVNDIKKLLKTSGIDINNPMDDDPNGFSPLMLAVMGEHSDAVKELLKHPDIYVSRGMLGTYPRITALRLAVDRNNTDIVADLLSHPRIDSGDIKNALDLVAIIKNGRDEIKEMLKAKIADEPSGHLTKGAGKR